MHPVPPSRERVFNVPFVVVALAAAMGIEQAIYTLVLTVQQQNQLLILFAFIPVRYDLTLLAAESWARGWGAAVWTFVTYAFIHGGLSHLFFNVVWLFAFGTPVARRFGALRFLIFFAVTAAAGAAVHLAFHVGDFAPVVGASAAISGAMAAAIRFAFQRRGPLATIGKADDDAYRVPAQPLTALLRDRRMLVFLAVWFGVNFVFGMIAWPGIEGGVAWEAHVGGFLAGLFGFALFDPVRHTDANFDAEPPTSEPGQAPGQAPGPETTIH
jgi:membrane associated rhomboid family serine protease